MDGWTAEEERREEKKKGEEREEEEREEEEREEEEREDRGGRGGRRGEVVAGFLWGGREEVSLLSVSRW
jgi:hypothetical protein